MGFYKRMRATPEFFYLPHLVLVQNTQALLLCTRRCQSITCTTYGYTYIDTHTVIPEWIEYTPKGTRYLVMKFSAQFMVTLVTDPHRVTESLVQERESLAGTHSTVEPSTLPAMVLQR